MKLDKQDSLQASRLKVFWQYIKDPFISCMSGILFICILLDLLLIYVFPTQHGNGVGFKTDHIQENTALEMHAEDIWRHGRSTLKTFDPFSCKVVLRASWPTQWLEVTCTSEDEVGQNWAYTVLYGTYSSPFIELIPFFKGTRKAREMKRVYTP